MLRLRLMMAGMLLLSASTGLGAIEFPVVLTAEEVECDRLQLERLALRMVVAETGPPGTEALNPSLFVWRRSDSGSYSGLAVSDGVQKDGRGKPFRDERQLSAEIAFGERGDVLDPRRPLLPNATLARRGQDSNLAVARQEHWLTITMEAAPQVEDPYLPKAPLVVNSLKIANGERQPLPAADAVSRGFSADGLTRPCHTKLTAFDERIFRILSRTVRLSTWFTPRGSSPSDPTAWNIVLFRGEDPHLYRATILGYVKTCDNNGFCLFFRFDPASLEIEVGWDAQGRLTNGEIRLVPQSQTSLLSIFALPPMRPGRDRQGEEIFAGKPFLIFDYLESPRNILGVPVNWGELLENSSWNQ